MTSMSGYRVCGKMPHQARSLPCTRRGTRGEGKMNSPKESLINLVIHRKDAKNAKKSMRFMEKKPLRSLRLCGER